MDTKFLINSAMNFEAWFKHKPKIILGKIQVKELRKWQKDYFEKDSCEKDIVSQISGYDIYEGNFNFGWLFE